MSWSMLGAVVLAYSGGYATRAIISLIRRRRARLEMQLKTWRPTDGPSPSGV